MIEVCTATDPLPVIFDLVIGDPAGPELASLRSPSWRRRAELVMLICIAAELLLVGWLTWAGAW